MTRSLVVATVALVAGLAAPKPNPVAPDPKTPRPIAAVDTVWIEDMTWMEIRDAMKDGKDTVIIATGGIEQNGPYLVTAKHRYVLKDTAEAIARKLGNALIAPIVDFVPEGDIDPPTVHMKYPGSISLTEETYQALVTDIVRSFTTHGFRHIGLIGDSGGNQEGLKAVAEKLNARWKGKGSRVEYIPEYYNYGDVAKWLEQNGIEQVPEGIHDDFGITAVMMTVDPNSVRFKQRRKAGKDSINGIKLHRRKTVEWGKRLVEFRADVAVSAIERARGEK